MTQVASITVQFQPFVLTLGRWSGGEWLAHLRMSSDSRGAPALVSAQSEPGRPETAARIDLEDATPRLRIGGATFNVPKKQLLRLRGWIDKQNAPVATVDTTTEGADPAPGSE